MLTLRHYFLAQLAGLPPAASDEASFRLSDHCLPVPPGTRHVMLGRSSCSVSILRAFVENHTQRPDASCMSSVAEPVFA